MSAQLGRPLEDQVRGDADTGDALTVARSNYRPHLDGLRAIAVYLVIAFHSGISGMHGGFIGVDVFFVLSGYLVTQLLVRDLLTLGRIRLTYFYSRRVRRLLPAALLTLLVSAIVFAAIASPSEFGDAIGAIRAACLYVTNWFFIHQSNDYFGADINASPVVHFWSLAIEEQFYLLWPLALFGLFAVTKRLRTQQWNAVRLVVTGLALASLIAALMISRSNLNRAYYGTDTRAYQMLTGALLAISVELIAARTWWRRWGRPMAVVSLLAVVGLATSLVDIAPIQRGFAVVLATSVLLLALDHGTDGVVKRGLSLGTVAFLGRISYGTYLWHWLIIVVAVRLFDPAPWPLFFLSAALATSIASLSYQVLERPIRISALLDRRRAAVIAFGLSISVICAVLIVPSILSVSSPSRAASAAPIKSVGTPVPSGLDWRAATKPTPWRDCFNIPPSACIVVHGKGPTVVLMGDSHAHMLLPAMEEVAKRNGWTLALLSSSACPWQDGLARQNAKCLPRKAYWRRRVIPALDPSLVILEEAPLDREGKFGLALRGPNGALPTGSRKAERAIESSTDATVARLRREGREVVIIEPIPQGPTGYDPLACLSKAKYLEECRFVADTRPTAIELHFRELADSDPHVHSIDIDKLACPFLPICDPYISGTVVWHDVSHLSALYVRTFAGPLGATFAAIKIGTG